MIRRAVWIVPMMFAAAVHAQEPGKVVPATAKASPLDQPIALLQEGRHNFTSQVKDYQCWLVSQERVNGVLLDKNVIKLKIKTEPFSVHMLWVEPAKFKNQDVVYVAGKNAGKMRVKSPIFPNAIGYVSIDINDPRVLKNSRHNITEAGIGNMIEENLKQWQIARQRDQTTVNISPFKYDNRDCIRIELIAAKPGPNVYCCRSVIYLEKESKIPIRLENYDFPRQGAPEDLIESFSYVNIQWNVGLKDAEFNK